MHTFNLWWGCWKISDGCKFCYAATFDRRVHGASTDHWDRKGSRRFMTEEYWEQPLRWNESAKRRGVRERVFVGSMCDWAEKHPDRFTNGMMNAFRRKLFELIKRCDHLDFLLLTKRIENVAEFLPWKDGSTRPWFNVWIGTTCEHQNAADHRIPILLSIKARVHWLSLEPLLGAIDLHKIRIPAHVDHRPLHFSALQSNHDDNYYEAESTVDWVVVGAESGHGARECRTPWIESLVDQCVTAEVPVLVKQAVASDVVTIGEGSRAKGKGYDKGTIVELPYIRGKQYEQYPEVAL